MSNIKNGGLDKYDVERFERQQFGTAGVEGANDYADYSNDEDQCQSYHLYDR